VSASTRGALKIHTGLEHRVFHVATFVEAVYVLHAFEKRTRTTPKQDLQLAQDRLRALVNRRRTDASKD
jgi:phage-related protein